MVTLSSPGTATPQATSAQRGAAAWWTLLTVAVLILLSAASLFIGSNPIPFTRVMEVLTSPDSSFEATVILEQRLPRTFLLVVVGAALAVAGALMQSMTRNPLADPGILGVNAGASFAVVLAVAAFGITSIWFYLWFAFAGAALAAVGVYILGAAGQGSPAPERLALAGVAVSMAVGAMVQTVILTDQNAFNEFRFWAAGSAEGRGETVVLAVAPFIAMGLVLAVASAPALNALALGEETARGLGVSVNLSRTLVVVAVTLLAGAATAAVGPIMFIGLGVPYLARAVCGSDQRKVLPYAALAGPCAMLLADLLARVVLPGQEVQVGIMTAILGGPVFVALVRRRRLEAM